MTNQRTLTKGLWTLQPLIGAGVHAAVIFCWVCAAASAQAGQPVTVTFTIQRIIELRCDEGLGERCPNDYYAEVNIGNQGSLRQPSTGAVDNNSDFSPNWTFTRTVDSDVATIPIEVKLFDEDDLPRDEQVDIADGHYTLNLTVDLATGEWRGDVPPNVQFSSGIQDEAARIFFGISLGGTSDIDQDGIPDSVERFGIYDEFGNRVDSMIGADPCRKTIAVEIDFMRNNDHSHRPTDAALQEVRNAFNSAPVAATLPCPYPGFPRSPSGIGILFHVDEALDEVPALDWGNGAETVRDTKFNSARRPYFHYSIWAHDLAAGNPSTGHAVGLDFIVSLGSDWLPRLTTRIQSGTLMHELGHTLGLDHGGGDKRNCKPNYLSVMNYSFQFSGIPFQGAGVPTVDIDGDGVADVAARLDYSRSPLKKLDETSLDEAIGISDGTDYTRWSPDGGLTIAMAIGNGPINWNRNVLPGPGGPSPVIEGDVAVDVNNLGLTDCAASPGDRALNGFDDWANLKFREGTADASGTRETLTASEWRRIADSLRQPPSVEFSLSPPPNVHGWNNTDVTVSLRAFGPGGVSRIRYSAAGAENRELTLVSGESATLSLAKEGLTTVSFSASNQFGDSVSQSVTVRIDKTQPRPSWLAHLLCEVPGADRRMVRIGQGSASDGLSGVDSVSVAASSSEADSGLEPSDLPGDIVIDRLAVSVRAEIGPSQQARVYTFQTIAIDKAGNIAVRPSQCNVYRRQ